MPGYNTTQSMYYSVDVGAAHLSFLNTETVIDTADIDDVQQAWLAADLAAASGAAMRVVTGHRPFYCTDGSNDIQCGGFAQWLRGRAESLFVDNNVALVVCSHEHGYERTWPVINSTVVSKNYTAPGAPTYVVSGAGGNREGNELPNGDQPWSAYGSAAVGYTLITLADATAHVQFVQADNGAVLDDFTISGAV